MWAKKWKSQRDTYRRKKKELITKSGQGATHQAKHKFADQMAFLDDFSMEPCDDGNCEAPADVALLDLDTGSNIRSETESGKTHVTAASASCTVRVCQPRKGGGRSRGDDILDAACEKIMKRMDEHSEVDSFFQSVATRVKKLDGDRQANLQLEVMQLLTKCEKEQRLQAQQQQEQQQWQHTGKSAQLQQQQHVNQPGMQPLQLNWCQQQQQQHLDWSGRQMLTPNWNYQQQQVNDQSGQLVSPHTEQSVTTTWYHQQQQHIDQSCLLQLPPIEQPGAGQQLLALNDTYHHQQQHKLLLLQGLSPRDHTKEQPEFCNL